jgi:digeranylgeranylglycerophospholipid reductase
MECDVLVVGAGPAGSTAAWAAAKNGAKTILIDKKKEVGVPVQCAEAIGSNFVPLLPFDIPENQLVWRIDGISFSIEDLTFERSGEFWSGHAINRKKFDKWLAKKAINSGAKLFLDTELSDLQTKGNYNVIKVQVKTDYGLKEIRPKVIIAADGVESPVLKLLGFNIDLDKTGYVYGFEFGGLALQKSNFDHIFLGDFAPGGYGYVFPLSETRANVGIGLLFNKTKIEKFFESFLEILKLKEILNKKSFMIKEKKGLVPFLSQTESCLYGNVLLVGDSANQNIKPFVEGILPGIICGNMAGESASLYISNRGKLNSYVSSIEKKCDLFEHSEILAKLAFEIGKCVNRKNDLIRLGISSNLISLGEVEYFSQLSYNNLKEIILKRYKNQ